MKIVYLSPSGSLGGAERCLLDMMASVQQADPGIEVHVLAASPGPLIERAKKLSAHVTLLPMPAGLVEIGDSILRGSKKGRAFWNLGRKGIRAGWSCWQYARQLNRTLAGLRPDVIHSNGIKFHLLASLARPQQVQLIWHIHDFLSFRPLMAKTLRWSSSQAQGAIAVSRAVQEDAQKVMRNLPVDLVYNGIDTAEFSPTDDRVIDLDHLAGLPTRISGTFCIGLVATYARWKGHDVFLRAAAKVLQNRPDVTVRFFIIGGPIYQTVGSQYSTDELRAIAADLAIDTHVGFIPFQDKPADVYRALDVVVHASTEPEPFGRAIVEAMSCGRPVIAAHAGGAQELFTHDYDALGFPPGNHVQLSEALGRLIADADRRQILAQNARRTVVARFSRQRLGPQLLDIYQKSLTAAQVEIAA